jgi:hypothetical protein
MNQEGQGEISKEMRLLAILVLIQCFGIAASVFHYGSEFLTTLWLNKLDGNLASAIDRVCIAIFMITAAVAAYRKSATLWGVVGFWVFFLAVNTFVQDGSFGASYVFFSGSIRYLSPLSLALYCYFRHDHERAHAAATSLLMLGAGVTFIGHGMEALNHNPQFIDFLIRFFRNYLGMGLLQSEAESMLTAIGLMDVMVGITVLLRPDHPVLMHMALWGFLTAAVRVLHSPSLPGLEGMLIRATNGGVPLVLALCALKIGARPWTPLELVVQLVRHGLRRRLRSIPGAS